MTTATHVLVDDGHVEVTTHRLRPSSIPRPGRSPATRPIRRDARARGIREGRTILHQRVVIHECSP